MLSFRDLIASRRQGSSPNAFIYDLLFPERNSNADSHYALTYCVLGTFTQVQQIKVPVSRQDAARLYPRHPSSIKHGEPLRTRPLVPLCPSRPSEHIRRVTTVPYYS